VTVTSVREICNWLRGCTYVHDHILFGEPDRLQTPAEFEARRRGDCEDHALWAWRKLHELGFSTELVVGRWLIGPEAENHHVWVIFTEHDGRRMLLEATTKWWGRMPVPLADVGHEYLPFYSIDGDLHTFTYGGYLLASERGDPTAI
jgi:predicted transglutaminase-like cysteine proteinase